MSDNITVKTFPSNAAEALTILYLQNQNINELTPEQLANKYKEIYDSMRNSLKGTVRFANKVL